MRNTIDEIIVVLQAVKAGKEIEWRRNNKESWALTNAHFPNFEDNFYRVKPTEPRQFILYNGGWRACGHGINPSEEIRVVEILPEEKL